MENSLILKIRDFFIRNIIILILFPVLTFFLICTSYGNELQSYLIKNPQMYCLYELSTLQKTLSQSNIPVHVSCIAVDMVVYSYALFSIWLILFAYSSYQKLKLMKYNFPIILIEFILLAFIFYLIVSPGLPVYFQILGWLFILLLALMIIVYFLLYSKMKYEKE